MKTQLAGNLTIKITLSAYPVVALADEIAEMEHDSGIEMAQEKTGETICSESAERKPNMAFEGKTEKNVALSL